MRVLLCARHSAVASVTLKSISITRWYRRSHTASRVIARLAEGPGLDRCRTCGAYWANNYSTLAVVAKTPCTACRAFADRTSVFVPCETAVRVRTHYSVCRRVVVCVNFDMAHGASPIWNERASIVAARHALVYPSPRATTTVAPAPPPLTPPRDTTTRGNAAHVPAPLQPLSGLTITSSQRTCANPGTARRVVSRRRTLA